MDPAHKDSRNPHQRGGTVSSDGRQHRSPHWEYRLIIDSHAYFGKWPYWPLPCSTVHELVGEMDRCGIDKAVVSSTRSLFTSWRDGNRESCEALAAFPGRFITFGVAGPSELSHTLEGSGLDIDNPAWSGFRLFPQYHTFHPLFEPFVDNLCEVAAARSLPVQLPLRLLMNWGMPMLAPEWIPALAERHPKVPWILTGLNYFHELRMGLALMRRFPSVYLETSCIQGFAAISKIVQQSGSEKLLFGSGLPLQNAAAGIEKIKRSGLPDRDLDAIFSRNLQQLLELSKRQI